MSNTTYDDTSLDIVYTGKWEIGGSEEELDHTTHGTKEEGAIATFTFTDSVVASTYSVDGSAPVSFDGYAEATTQYSQCFFQSTPLPEGDHELVITVVSSGAYYWLDYLVAGDDGVPASSSATPTQESTASSYSTSNSILIPSSSATASPTSTITSYKNHGSSDAITATAMTTSVPVSTVSSLIIDDTNSNIVYGGSWFASNEPGEYDGTAHATQDDGATATLQFTGTQIAVFGTIPPFSLGVAPQTSSYQIDDDTPVSVTLSPTSYTLYQQLFFQSPSLQDGKHTLVVTSVSGGYTFSIDYFAINSTSSSSPSISSLPSSSVSAAISSSSTQPNSQTSSATSSSHAGAIAGGVFAALLFISLPIAAFFWYRRRKARRAPSRFAPKTPDPSWLSAQTWPNEKPPGSGPRYEPVV
ncbi:hypothetical protein H0H92_010466 [Tricholoma furcatifolium]|nr:hypothetical protein H0H92_010466 [Tricholoma furcatifolium]